MPLQPAIAPPPAPPLPGAQITVGPNGVRIGDAGDAAIDVNVEARTEVPTTPQQMANLRARRSELSRQLSSAQGRRDELAGDLRDGVDGADRAGLEARLQVLDQRIIGIEREIASTGRLVALAPASAGGRGDPFAPLRAGRNIDLELTPIIIVFILAVLMPVALATARGIWKRGSRPAAPAPGVDQTRFDRIEQALDAVAVEVERIGEGQRFVTQLLAESRTAQPVPQLGATRAAESMRQG